MVEERAREASRTHRVVLTLLLGWLAFVAAPAQADTSLVGSAPVDGARVTSHPESVTLEFRNRILGPAAVAVLAPDGSRVDAGEPVIADTRVQQPVAPIGNGEYTVVFRVVAEDGHAVKGNLRFVVAVPAEPSWWSRNGPQVTGAGAVLLVVGGVAALRLRASRPLAP